MRKNFTNGDFILLFLVIGLVRSKDQLFVPDQMLAR